jgi:predicted small secreted protein
MLSKKLTIAALLAALTLSLGACETVKGAGRDLQNAGESMQRAVN